MNCTCYEMKVSVRPNKCLRESVDLRWSSKNRMHTSSDFSIGVAIHDEILALVWLFMMTRFSGHCEVQKKTLGYKKVIQWVAWVLADQSHCDCQYCGAVRRQAGGGAV